RDVTTAAIRAEESVWFQVSYIGSRAAFGTLPAGALEARRVDSGRTLAEHMAQCGAQVEAVRAGTASLQAKSIKAWVELHIEQAPQLVEAGLPMAVGLDEMWKDSEAAGRPMAFTIGRFHTDPAEHALTKVAGEMALCLDVRAYDKAHLAELEKAVLRLVGEIEPRRGVRFDLGVRASAEVAPSDPGIVDGLLASAKALGVPTMPLASPASHDTATFTVAGVPSPTLFVRNANGSHNPREAMEIRDFLQASAVLAHWLAGEANT